MILNADSSVLNSFRRICDDVDFEDILALAFEKLLYLKYSTHLYEYVHRVATYSREVVDINALLTQVLAVSRHVDDEYRWMKMDLTFNSFFLETYRLKTIRFDDVTDSMFLKFEEID